MSEGARNIVAAMKAHGVDKVVACTSGGWRGRSGGSEGWGVSTGQAAQGPLQGIGVIPSYCAFIEHQLCAWTLLDDAGDTVVTVQPWTLLSWVS